MNTLKTSFLLLSLVLLINTSCKTSVDKDLSLTVKEYQGMGFPAPGKIWTNQDYQKALSALSSLRLRNHLTFPRKNSKKSGPIFERLLNTENLSFVNDSTLSLSEKAIKIQYFSAYQNDLIRMYTDNLQAEQYYDEELIDIYIFGLSVYKKMLELAKEIMMSEDASISFMQSGLQAVLFDYKKLIFTIMAEQVKSDDYLTKDLERLSNEVMNSLLENQKMIEPADKKLIMVDIRHVLEKSPTKNIKNNYLKILELLQ